MLTIQESAVELEWQKGELEADKPLYKSKQSGRNCVSRALVWYISSDQ